MNRFAKGLYIAVMASIWAAWTVSPALCGEPMSSPMYLNPDVPGKITTPFDMRPTASSGSVEDSGEKAEAPSPPADPLCKKLKGLRDKVPIADLGPEGPGANQPPWVLEVRRRRDQLNAEIEKVEAEIKSKGIQCPPPD